MRWTNKIMSNNQDQSNSRLSSRSLSKFKKFNLQKSEVEISSNDHLEKSQLKLTSVEKIKQTNFNRSYISNYIGLTGANANTVPSLMSTNVEKSDYRFSKTHHQKNKNSLTSKSYQIFPPQVENQINKNTHQLLEGYALFPTNTQKSSTDHYTIKFQQSPKKQNLSSQQKLKKIMQKLKLLFLQLKEVSQSIKAELKQDFLISYEKIQTGLTSYVKQVESNLYIEMQNLMNLTKKQHIPSNFNIQNIFQNHSCFPPTTDHDGFYKIKCFDHQRIHEQSIEIQRSLNRPNSFKNKFKQMIDDSDHNLAQINQIDKEHIKRKNQLNQKSNKIFRKRTNPTPRVNSLLDNDSCLFNESSLNNDHNTSTNSIKYCKINERSASKSVKKLHEKIILIKNIFKSQTSYSEADKNDNPKFTNQNS